MRTALMISAAMILGVCVILAFEVFQEDFQSWLERNIIFLLKHPMIVFFGSLLFVSPILAVGIYLLLFGSRTVHAQRFPPPGYSVVRDTVVVEGPQALRRGRVIQLLSLFLLCAAGAFSLVMWHVFRSFASAT